MSIIGDIFGLSGSGRAANSVSDANIAAEHGVLDATANGQAGIQNAVTQAGTALPAAASTAAGAVNTATDQANDTLQRTADAEKANISPYLAAGAQGANGLATYAASNPQFNFSLDDYLNSPAMKFQMDQGTRAIQNNLAAQGLGASGAALKELTNYGQGLASTYYQQAFNNANTQFNTNQNTTLSNLSALINTGLAGSGLYQSAAQNSGNQQAANTVNAGTYTGNTGLNVQQLLAELGIQGSEASGQLGQRGAEDAGNFAVGAGTAHAGGILAQGNALTSLIGDSGNFLQNLPQLIAGV